VFVASRRKGRKLFLQIWIPKVEELFLEMGGVLCSSCVVCESETVICECGHFNKGRQLIQHKAEIGPVLELVGFLVFDSITTKQ
jgi:hypothetical protein